MVYRFVALMIVIAIGAVQPAKAQLTPRQLFYDEGTDKKKPPATPPPATPGPKPKKAAVPPKPVQPPKAKPGDQPEPIKMVGPPEQKVTLPVAFKALVLRYSVHKMLTDEETIEVDSETSFRNGEKIQLKVEGNQAGYMYVFSQGTSGIWKPIFPSAEVDGADNKVRAHQPVLLPGEEYTISFSGKPGAENLFIVYSRSSNEDIDKLIYAQKNAGLSVLAANRPVDSEVEKLKLTTRDLVIERIKGKTTASPKTLASSAERMSEAAVYVSSADTSAGAKVTAEIRLKHE